MPPRFKDHHKSSYYSAETTAMIDKVERLCGQSNGTMTVGFSQAEERLADRVGGGGVCYALVKGWLAELSRGRRGAETYAVLPVRADAETRLFKSVLRDQLNSRPTRWFIKAAPESYSRPPKRSSCPIHVGASISSPSSWSRWAT